MATTPPRPRVQATTVSKRVNMRVKLKAALADPRLRLSFDKSRALELDALALRSVMLRNRPSERRERRLVYLWGGIYVPVEPADYGEPLSGRRAQLVHSFT